MRCHAKCCQRPVKRVSILLDVPRVSSLCAFTTQSRCNEVTLFVGQPSGCVGVRQRLKPDEPRQELLGVGAAVLSRSTGPAILNQSTDQTPLAPSAQEARTILARTRHPYRSQIRCSRIALTAYVPLTKCRR